MKNYIVIGLILLHLGKPNISVASDSYKRYESNLELFIDKTPIDLNLSKKLQIDSFKILTPRHLYKPSTRLLRVQGGTEALSNTTIFRPKLSKRESFYIFIAELCKLLYSLIELFFTLLLRFFKLCIDYIIKNLETDSFRKEVIQEEKRIAFHSKLRNIKDAFYRLCEVIKPNVNIHLETSDSALLRIGAKEREVKNSNNMHPLIKWFQKKRAHTLKLFIPKIKK
jgi:hypothetical protein